jgi:hypothetical protein
MGLFIFGVDHCGNTIGHDPEPLQSASALNLGYDRRLEVPELRDAPSGVALLVLRAEEVCTRDVHFERNMGAR